MNSPEHQRLVDQGRRKRELRIAWILLLGFGAAALLTGALLGFYFIDLP